MRITLVLPGFNLSGGIRVLAIYAERLHRRGHQLHAVAPRDIPPTFLQSVKSYLRGRGWPPRIVREPSHFDGLPFEQRLLPHSGPITDRDVPDADVILATWWETVPWVAKLSDNKGAKVHFVQHYETYGGTVEEVDAAYSLPVPKIVVSNWLRDLLDAKFHQKPVAMILNCVDSDQFYAPARGKQAQPTVGMLYHTLPIKGCDISLKAYDRAVQALPGLKLVAIGEMQVAPDLPLPRGAEFIHRARDQKLRETYGRCDAWLFASRLEGFGLPLLEAMACRTPVIATPAGAAPELLSQGGGILVPQEDAEAMGQAIVKVCTLPDAEWRAMSDKALATATAQTWDDATDLLEQTLQEIVQNARSPRS
jgi:glycosyltransferase involved in cell wall biosynthesis